jgi:hypothetical protein
LPAAARQRINFSPYSGMLFFLPAAVSWIGIKMSAIFNLYTTSMENASYPSDLHTCADGSAAQVFDRQTDNKIE